MKILVVEAAGRVWLKEGLSKLGLQIDLAVDCAEAIGLGLQFDYDVIVFDVLLPALDDLAFLTQLKDSGCRSRVMILSDRNETGNKVAALNFGADDYLSKPYAFQELHARILALCRRRHNQIRSRFAVGGLVVDVGVCQVTLNHIAVPLTPNEYSIFEKLAVNRGRIVTYGLLEDHLYSHDKLVSRNALEAHVSSLRKKLRASGSLDVVKTRRGFGYLIE